MELHVHCRAQARRVQCAVPALQPGKTYCVLQKWGAVVRQARTLCCQYVQSLCSAWAGKMLLGCQLQDSKINTCTSLRAWGWQGL